MAEAAKDQSMADLMLKGLAQSNPVTSLLGGVLGGIGGLQQRKKQQMIDTEYNKSAYRGLQQTRDSLSNMNPYATAAATTANLTNAQSAAMAQAANVGAGQAAAAGNGGDIQMGNIAAMKSAIPVMAAAAQFEGQKAQVQQGALAQDMQKQAQLTQTNKEIGDLSNHMNLIFQDQPGIMDFLSGSVAGMNKGVDAYNLFLGYGPKQTTDQKDTDGQNNTNNQNTNTTGGGTQLVGGGTQQTGGGGTQLVNTPPNTNTQPANTLPNTQTVVAGTAPVQNSTQVPGLVAKPTAPANTTAVTPNQNGLPNNILNNSFLGRLAKGNRNYNPLLPNTNTLQSQNLLPFNFLGGGR